MAYINMAKINNDRANKGLRPLTKRECEVVSNNVARNGGDINVVALRMYATEEDKVK